MQPLDTSEISHLPLVELLEQAGISWPIRNPLYLPDAYGRINPPSQASPAFPCAPILQDLAADVQNQSPLSHRSNATAARQPNADSRGRIRPHLPTIPRLSKPSNASRGNERPRLRDELPTALGDDYDGANMRVSSKKPPPSCSTADVVMPDFMFTSSHPMKQHPLWINDTPVYEQSTSITRAGHRLRKDDRQYAVNLQDDQFGQIIQTTSPARKHRELPYSFGNPQVEPMARPPTAHMNYPPKSGHVPAMTRPSTASMARTSSYSDFNSALRNASNKSSKDRIQSPDTLKGKSFPAYRPSFSGNKENRPPSQARLPTPYAWANRVPTPNPFAHRLPVFDPDMPSTEFRAELTGHPRVGRMSTVPPLEATRVASAHGPSTMGSVRSRKEGIAADSPQLLERDICHDQGLLLPNCAPIAPDPSIAKELGKYTRNAHCNIPPLAEIIDVDALDSQVDPAVAVDAINPTQFKSMHKPGMSSIDSTSRLEQQLFSALGEELGGFEETVDVNGMGPELARAIGCSTTESEMSGSTILNPSAREFEPTFKRKRQGTLGGERDRSPSTKREKAGLDEAEEMREENMPRLKDD